MLFDDILAQKEPIRTLKRALESNRIAQAYLFEGPSGVGKEKTAIALASSAICQAKPEGCGVCDICNRVRSGNHPDIRVFPPRDEGNRNLQVEFVREQILPFTSYAPFESERSFLIFPDADISFPSQHAEAANALLKTLEEPRSRIHFILISQRPDRLLSTIRSRCQRVGFGRLTRDVLTQILQTNSSDGAAIQAAIALADGRADRALVLIDNNCAEQMLEFALRVDDALIAGHAAPLLNLGEELAKSDDLPLIMDTLALFYRDLAACCLKCPESELLFQHRANIIEERSAQISAAQAAERVYLIHNTLEMLQRNANKEISLDAMLFKLGSV